MISRWLDRIVLWLIILLILATPLAVGSVEPWGYSLAEVAIFVLLAALGARILCGRAPLLSSSGVIALVAPLGLFIALDAFQLIPLPPGLERVISPSTYRLYAQSLSGWPSREPYGEPPDDTSRPSDIAVTVILPSVEQVRDGFPIPYAPGRRSKATTDAPPQGPAIKESTPVRSKARAASALDAADWRALSITPSLAKPLLIKFIAYTCLFVVILVYPFGGAAAEAGGASEAPSGAERAGESASCVTNDLFYRTLMSAVIIAGLVVAAAGLLEHAYPNGRVSWIFTPYSWQRGNPWGTRATGTFANPDHFANYLNLVLPLALAGAFFPASVARKRRSEFRLLCAITTLILLCALILSASRAGWIGASLALAVMVRGATLIPPEARPPWLRGRKATGISLSLILAAAITMALFWIGAAGRAQADLRVEETISDQNLAERLTPALDSLPMVRDFPLFGVGLGCWSEIFPQYQRPPWASRFWNAAHDDYVQSAAETGLLGFGLLAWFFVLAGRRIYQRLSIPHASLQPLPIAVLAAAGMMAFHEFVDFPLQIPANALLLTILLALALRMVRVEQPHENRTTHASAINYFAACAASIASLTLIIVVVRQDRIPYPYNVEQPKSVPDARGLILEYPASSEAHLAMVEIAGAQMSPANQLEELRIATRLEPANPMANDLYALELFGQRQTSRALGQVMRSVFLSPSPDTHFYLSRTAISGLSVPERNAVENGYQAALSRGYEGALGGLGDFYDALERFSPEGDLYAGAAAVESDRTRKTRYLIVAGLSYTRAGQPGKSIAAFREAAQLEPDNSQPYAYLATRVFGPARNTQAINAVIVLGINHGADPFTLYLAAAEADEAAGDREAAEAQLRKAVTMRPADFDALERLGRLYMREDRYAMAALWMRKAAAINPSAEAFYNLAVAEEDAYDYFAASRSYAKALALAPSDPALRSGYLAFQSKLTRNEGAAGMSQ
jgi:O-antigen ligase/tetratricopeptide (TPR) repeat protein